MKFSTILASASLLFGGASADTVVEIAVGTSDTFSTLVDFAVQADLVDALNTTQGITVFAPTNDAFAALAGAAPDVVSNLQTDEWKPHLQDVLLYHVLGSKVPSSAVTNGLTATALNGEDLAFTVNGDGIFVNTNSQVILADVEADNGVIHAIDNVLIPSWVGNSIADLAIATPALSTLVDLVVQAGLVDTLSGPGPFTVFAPTNDAFVEFLGDTDPASLDIDTVTSVLTYHVVPGIVAASDIADGATLTTVQGEELTFSLSDSGAKVNGENIVSTDILANNGIVHVIGGVLLPPAPAPNTVVDLAVANSDTFSTLVDFVVAAGLADALSTLDGITVFAPTNDAFAALAGAAPSVVANLQTDEWSNHLQDVLLYHVLDSKVPSSAVTDGLTATALNGEDLAFTVNGDGIFVNTNSQVILADVEADNGVIHAIDNVLIPSWVGNSIADLAIATPALSTLVDLVVKAGLVDTLSGPGPFTVFAPTNDAFVEFLGDTDPASLDIDTVTSVLTYHVVPGIVAASDIADGATLTTVQGEELTFSLSDSGAKVNGENIVSTDILANNGIVHVIGGVLLPPGPPGPPNTVVDVAVANSDTFSTLVDFVVAAGLADALSTLDGITVFAPTNDAFAALAGVAPSVVANLQTDEWSNHLQDVLLYHVLDSKVPSSAVTDGLKATALNGEGLSFTVNKNDIFVNTNSEVILADVPADNGVIHAIDNVLLPSWLGKSLFDLIERSDDLSNTLKFIEIAQNVIENVLSTAGAYTLFAPTDEAWQGLLDELQVNYFDVLREEQVTGILTTALKYHVVSGIYDSSDIEDGVKLTTLQGETVTLSLTNATEIGALVNDIEITAVDFLANNGILHKINGVLIPKEILDAVAEASATVVDVAVSNSDTFSTLVDFVVAADLADALSTLDGITVFTPTNDAFAALAGAAPEVVANLQTEEWKTHLQNVLAYHVLDSKVPSSAVTDGLTATALNGEDLSFTVNGDGIFVNTNSEVILADVPAANGVIHAIDNVLIPSWVSNSIADLASATPDLSILLDLVVKASLAETLAGPGPFTVFAPTNDAFLSVLENISELDDLDVDTVATVLTYHVVPGIYSASAITSGLELTTVLGETISFNVTDGGVFVEDIAITSTDILGNNGIVHTIGGVMFPKAVLDAAKQPESSAKPTQNIVEIAAGADDFSTLVALVGLADESIATALSSPGEFTVFAPVNAAFGDFLETVDIDVDGLKTLEDSNDFLSRILKYHVVAGIYKSTDIVDGLALTTLQGEDIVLNLSGDSPTGVTVNGADVLAADVEASNGVIHVIDAVLIAPNHGAPGTSIGNGDETDLTYLLYAFYGVGVILILGSLLAAVRKA